MASRGVGNYIQAVLVPELACLLIKHDLKLDHIHVDVHVDDIHVDIAVDVDVDGEGEGEPDGARPGKADARMNADERARRILVESTPLGEILHDE